ncbi:MAG: FecR domain-containing protein [Paenibacillus sp.]|nr:FecR domain-containing protein [Paenibacillus sp.]
MPQKATSYRSLFLKSLLGSLTPEEENRLEAWIQADKRHRQLADTILDQAELTREYRQQSLVDSRSAYLEMKARIMLAEAPRRRRNRIISAAAAIASIVVVSILWFNTPSVDLDTSSVARATMAMGNSTRLPVIKPGVTKALLHNASGKSIALNSGASVIASREIISKNILDSPLVPQELCLEVPRGGEFKIVLEDSTIVWLNSESTLRYPETFGPSERRVEVSGEAYFAVHKDPDRPFYVETRGQQIRVYGTTFNIRDYPDEESTFTTLESGSISLRQNLSGPSGEIFLAKGHQAILNHPAEDLKMTVVDPETVSSWRNGLFVFEDQPLDRIMRDLSRWYDFRYEFANPELAQQIFMGSIPRYSDFHTAIQILENCGNIHFSISSNNKILIY